MTTPLDAAAKEYAEIAWQVVDPEHGEEDVIRYRELMASELEQSIKDFKAGAAWQASRAQREAGRDCWVVESRETECPDSGWKYEFMEYDKAYCEGWASEVASDTGRYEFRIRRARLLIDGGE